MTNEEKLEFIKNKVRKTCVNGYRSFDLSGVRIFENEPINVKEITYQWYRHPDLNTMSKEAFEKGENWFFCEPIDPDNEYGHMVKCNPKYEYILPQLTQKEYDMIFGEDNND